MKKRISSAGPYASKFVDVYGAKIHYYEAGRGDPIIFLHGIPASSYIWRNIIPHLSNLGRCIALDFVGFGKSDKPDIDYTIDSHRRYFAEFIESLNLKKLTLVMHGWGSVIGLDYAMQHENNCKGLVFYEAFLRELNKDDVSLPYEEQLLSLQDQENVFDLVTSGTIFIDKLLPQYVMRTLSEEEMQHYREPFTQEGAQKAVAQYIKELPSVNGRAKIDKLIAAYSKKLTKSILPKLMLYSVPGFITTIADVIWAKENLPNLEIVEVGEEFHFAQESYPDLIGDTISVWFQGIEQAQKQQRVRSE